MRKLYLVTVLILLFFPFQHLQAQLNCEVKDSNGNCCMGNIGCLRNEVAATGSVCSYGSGRSCDPTDINSIKINCTGCEFPLTGYCYKNHKCGCEKPKCGINSLDISGTCQADPANPSDPKWVWQSYNVSCSDPAHNGWEVCRYPEAQGCTLDHSDKASCQPCGNPTEKNVYCKPVTTITRYKCTQRNPSSCDNINNTCNTSNPNDPVCNSQNYPFTTLNSCKSDITCNTSITRYKCTDRDPNSCNLPSNTCTTTNPIDPTCNTANFPYTDVTICKGSINCQKLNCNGTCTKNSECGNNYVCSGGSCRNSQCSNQINCLCPPRTDANSAMTLPSAIAMLLSGGAVLIKRRFLGYI